MSLESSLSVAASGLQGINRHLAVVSQNVANVGTPGYARQVLPQASMSADGQGMGVRTQPAQRQIDLQLQQAALQQSGIVAGLEVMRTSLAAIDAVHGTTGQGDDLSGLLGRLGDGFVALAVDPSSQPRQAAVATAADALARQVNRLHGAYGAARQDAHDALVADVGRLNDTLAEIGALSTRIVQVRALGQSTADLENQRDAARAVLAQLVDIRSLETPTGDMLLTTPSGLSLPTRFTAPPFALDAATLDASTWYPGGGVAGITLAGQDVTGKLATGRIGANLALRDTVLPTFQAELDEFAVTLARRFETQGLRLFTDADGAVPPVGGTPVQDGYVGLAGTLRVNAAVAADPALVRDGTHDVADDPSGPSAFTTNPASGPAGFATLLERVLNHSLGAEVRAGVAQPLAERTGLGPDGTLAAPYASPVRLSGLAVALVSAQTRQSAEIAAGLDGARTLQTALDDRIAEVSGVSIDQEMTVMVQLQSAYAANARVIAAVQAMMDQTLQMVR